MIGMMPSARFLTFGVFLAGFGVFTNTSCSRSGSATEREPAKADIPTVSVAKVTAADLSRGMVLTAEFKPYQEVDVMAKVAGYIKKINVDVGDRVKQGDLLATLEIPEMADDLTSRESCRGPQQRGSGARQGRTAARAIGARHRAPLVRSGSPRWRRRSPGWSRSRRSTTRAARIWSRRRRSRRRNRPWTAASQQVDVNNAELCKDPDHDATTRG